MAPEQRISDAEREQLVERLGGNLTAGRLTIDEFDQRVARVYRAVTVDEALRVFDDLPAVTVPQPARDPAPGRRLPTHQRVEWSAWLGIGGLNVAIWAVVSLATASWVYPWPIWVLGPWGLVLLGRTVLGIEGGGCGPRSRTHREHAHPASFAYPKVIVGGSSRSPS
ncbi:DUF1707 SHOCT-like domain-containing protein [Rhodococcus chondri]|uniref:DUF1707 domain-containing protein n=1 Tax=Rhodococcus chondri TaxID=3065941 RepID=A0ABU7K074_9NOCA|nr:DUF1707 domain-containing protein [Rhodococcus sp. CC-R104]MEE2035452.1 DUF1707 domain-containing protein [Rhodococcus sp. CC-R104]